MKGKLLLGGVLIIVGFILAVITASGLTYSRDAATTRNAPTATVGDQNEPVRTEVVSMALPIVAGLSIAAGAVLVGIGMGSFRRPIIVPPDSPKADEAATTRPLGDEGAAMPRRKAGA